MLKNLFLLLPMFIAVGVGSASDSAPLSGMIVIKMFEKVPVRASTGEQIVLFGFEL